jgi:hypothetical protein
MFRTRIRTIERPESTPTLAFEHFNPDGSGNYSSAADAVVVYLPEKELLLHNGKHYNLHKKLPDGVEIVDLFLSVHGTRSLLVLKMKHPSYGTTVHQQNCYFVAIPDVEQQAKLTTLLQRHGDNMTESVGRVKAEFKRIKSLFSTLNKDMNDVCPGYEPFNSSSGGFAGDDNNYPIQGSEEFDDMETYFEDMLEMAVALAKVEPFSKKRKA